MKQPATYARDKHLPVGSVKKKEVAEESMPRMTKQEMQAVNNRAKALVSMFGSFSRSILHLRYRTMRLPKMPMRNNSKVLKSYSTLAVCQTDSRLMTN